MLPEFDVSGLSVEEPEGTGSPVSVTVNVVRKGGTMNVVKVFWSASLNSKWDIDIDFDTKSGGSSNCLSLVTENLL